MKEIVEEKLKAKAPEKCRNMLCLADKEYLFLLMLVLKNEARGNRHGYRENIHAICCEPENRQLIRGLPVVVKQNANRLLYLVMKHPNGFTIRLLRLAMIVYYR
jgi:hypothetical protein